VSKDRNNSINLSAEDRAVLDMLVERGFDASALPPMSPERRLRVQAVQSVFGLLSDYPVEDADDLLVDATMARIARSDRSHRPIPIGSARMDSASVERRRWRIPDLVSIAAIVLILASIAIPVLSNVRRQMVDEGCATNMRTIAQAFTQYASDYEGRMPVARAGFGHGWDSFSNSLNLKPLVDHGYCDQGHMDCPGNHEHGGPSYSYQFQAPKLTYIWGVTNLGVVFADRNPLIDAARALKVPPPPMSMSINHGGRGQNTLQGDGAVIFLVQPAYRRDNIWLPEGKSTLSEGDEPASDQDIFLVH
jgi:hypothetical protein